MRGRLPVSVDEKCSCVPAFGRLLSWLVRNLPVNCTHMIINLTSCIGQYQVGDLLVFREWGEGGWEHIPQNLTELLEML